MAEAIGLASGILALASAAIKTTKAVVDLINGIKDAPSHISDLQHDVQSLRSILLRLETAEKQRLATAAHNSKRNSNASLPVAGAAMEDAYDTIRDQLKHCKTVLKGVEDELEPVTTQMKGGKKQIVWASICVAFSEKAIKEHSSRLYKAKTELLITMVIDIRFAVLGASTNKQPPGPISSPTNDDPPPEYPGLDPKIKRRDSNLIRDAIRNSSVVNRLKSSGSKKGRVEEQQDEASSQLPTFSQVISSTMDNMSKSVASETKGDYSISTFKMLWKDDLERIQSLWNLEKETVQHLKRTINDHMCEIFTTSLSANISTAVDIKDAAEGTLGWIDTTDEYIQWQEPTNDQRVLLLEGKAGSGKSVFTKTLCHITQQSIGKEKPVLLSYFCNKRVRRQESCIEILKAFVCQYLKENKADFTPVYKQCKPLTDHWDPAEPGKFIFSFQNLRDIFTTILQISKKPIYCIVDAMDECHSDDDMEKLIFHFPNLLRQNTNTRLFMSSRPDWIADTDLSAFNSLKIVLNSEVTEKDISQVIELELCRLQSKLTIDDKDKAALKKKITQKAEGMMLWIVLAFRRIQEHIKRMLSPTLKWLEKMIEKLPREIFGMYDHIMATIREKYGKPHLLREVDSSSEEEEEESSNLAIYGKLVLWVARCGRPLTVKELQFALALDMKDTCLADMKKKINSDIERVIGRIPFLEIVSAERSTESIEDEEDIYSPAKFFLPQQASVPSSTVRFIHQSAREYILRSADASNEKTPDDGTTFRYPKLDDACIGDLCVNFLSFKDFDNGPMRDFQEPIRFKESFKKFLDDCGFLEYCSGYWGYHLNRASNLDDATKAHVADWISNRKNNMRVYFQVSNFTLFSKWIDYIDGEFGIIAAAGMGVGWLTDYMIENKYNLDERDEWGRTGYQLAVGRGHEACAEKLANAGADTGQEFLIRFPMGRLCWDSIPNLIKSLEEGTEGDDMEETVDEFGRTPIFYACARGDAELLAAVLEKNPNLGFKDQYGRLPIDVTLDLECRELMLEKMKRDGIKSNAAMAKKVPCLHNKFPPEMPYLLQTLYCDFCGRSLRTFYFHCCDCSTEDDGFNVCKLCHNNGKRCLDPSADHKLLGRVTADWLVSSLDYTPHIANVKVESPIKWTLEKVEESADENNEEVSRQDGITPVQTMDAEVVVYEGKGGGEGAVVRVEALEEKDAGCCKCVIQ
ncbi:hypothetical protein TWF481_009595 [Arthrobotrys musiformis]|uniref:NACHT domain-containing protein n=1 Tax=Arthrobotrys musiformis TaxID=47236 RepID=A0AAV9W574_9PEZI